MRKIKQNESQVNARRKVQGRGESEGRSRGWERVAWWSSCWHIWRSAEGTPRTFLPTVRAKPRPALSVCISSALWWAPQRPTLGSIAYAAWLPFGGSVSCPAPSPLMGCVQKYCKRSLFEMEPEPPFQRDCLAPWNVKTQNNLSTGLEQHCIPQKCLQRQQKSRYYGYWTDEYSTEN